MTRVTALFGLAQQDRPWSWLTITLTPALLILTLALTR